MTLRDWNEQIKMLDVLRERFGKNFATVKNEGIEGVSIFFE